MSLSEETDAGCDRFVEGAFANMLEMLVCFNFGPEVPVQPCALIAASWRWNSALVIFRMPLPKSSLSFLHFSWIERVDKPPIP
jgi:hypothetical protein